MLVLSMSCGRKMKNTPIFYKNRNRNCKGLGYDLQLNFSKFLREARSHADAASLRQMETAKMRGTRKKKKTWIRALSLFFNCRQKKKSEEEEEEAPLKAKALKLSGVEQRPWLSGRLFGNGSKFGQLRHKMGLSSSGPLSFCFTPAMAEETEVPYRSLGHQSHALRAQAFGPIYLVT